MSLTFRDDPLAAGQPRDNPLRVPGWLTLLLRAIRSMRSLLRRSRPLEDLDAHLLRDIGLTRMEVRCGRAARARAHGVGRDR